MLSFRPVSSSTSRRPTPPQPPRRPSGTARRTAGRASRTSTLAASLATICCCWAASLPATAAPPDGAPRAAGGEAFAPPAGNASHVARLELRNEASVNDGNVTLRQLCRWADADESTFAAFADLVVLRLPQGAAFGTVTIEQVQTTLRDAGLNPGAVNFVGSTACTATRADVAVDERAALAAWTGQQGDAKSPVAPVAAPKDPDPQAPASAVATDVADLKSKLITDVGQRLKLPLDVLQVDFRPEDRGVLALSAPWDFQIVAQRYGDLGEVSWLVTIVGPGTPKEPTKGDTKRVRIVANARAWMDQAIAKHAIAAREAIDADDVEPKRVLADHLPSDPWLTKDQTVGQQAARDVRPGMPLSGRMVTPIELIRPGQLVTVFMRRGAIEVKSVARAMQSGTNGQVVKLKNESTGETYTATVTGRQTASVGDVTPPSPAAPVVAPPSQPPMADVR